MAVCRGGERKRAEVEHDEQRAEKQHADFGRDVGEGQHDRHADDQLRCDEIVILEAFGEAGFRNHQIDGDGGEPASGEGRADGRGDVARMGVDREDQGIDDVAGCDHRLDLTALSGTARQHLRRRPGTHAFQFSRDRMQKRGRSGAHDLAVDGTQAEKSTWEAFRFGIFWNPCRAEKTVLLPLFGSGNCPDRGNVARSDADGREAAIASRFHRSRFV